MLNIQMPNGLYRGVAMEWKKINNHEIYLYGRYKIMKNYTGDGYDLFKKTDEDGNEFYVQIAHRKTKQELFDMFNSDSECDDIVLCNNRPTYSK